MTSSIYAEIYIFNSIDLTLRVAWLPYQRWECYFLIRVQFHQRSTSIFCANSLAPVKYKLKMQAQKKLCAILMYVKATRRTLVKLTPGLIECAETVGGGNPLDSLAGDPPHTHFLRSWSQSGKKVVKREFLFLQWVSQI